MIQLSQPRTHSSLQLPALGSHTNEPVTSQAWMKELKGLYPFQLNFWLQIYSGIEKWLPSVVYPLLNPSGSHEYYALNYTAQVKPTGSKSKTKDMD